MNLQRPKATVLQTAVLPITQPAGKFTIIIIYIFHIPFAPFMFLGDAQCQCRTGSYEFSVHRFYRVSLLGLFINIPSTKSDSYIPNRYCVTVTFNRRITPISSHFFSYSFYVIIPKYECLFHIRVAAPIGLEPITFALTAHCSTD